MYINGQCVQLRQHMSFVPTLRHSHSICNPAAHPPSRCMPNQLCDEVHLFLGGAPVKRFVLIRAHSKDLNCFNWNAHEFVVIEFVVVNSVIYSDPLWGHGTTLGVETMFACQRVYARPASNKLVSTSSGSTFIVFGISIGQCFGVVLLRKLDKPITRDCKSVVLDMSLRLPFRMVESEGSSRGSHSLLTRRDPDLECFKGL
ncbi:hypothetical protein EDB19DRAFT_1663297 [Suillus lakei]|nr:hypothetical protein EDB19DRAFT_1663297 [Suillus lakei]